jgi:hypothetical protein
MAVVLQMLLVQIGCYIISIYGEDSNTALYAIDESKWYVKNYSPGEVKFSIGNYIDTVDCNVAPLSTCHLLLGQPWQFDLDATHGGRSNTYSFVHKGMSHMLKSMMETAIKVDIFPVVRKKKKDPPMDTPKLRTALLQREENDVTISNTSDKPPTKDGPRIISKPRTVLHKEERIL